MQPRVTVNEVVLGARLSPQDVWEAGGRRRRMGQPLAVEALECLSSRRGQVTGHRPGPQGGRDSGLAVRADCCQSAAAWAD